MPKNSLSFTRKLINSFVFCLCCSTALEAAENSQSMETFSLQGTNWQLLKLTVLGGFEFTPADPGDYVLNFRSENRLTGDSDCNSLSGTWVQEGTQLRFEPFVTTRRLCQPGSLHNNLVLYLKDVQTLQLRNDHLIMRTAVEGVEIEFESRD